MHVERIQNILFGCMDVSVCVCVCIISIWKKRNREQMKTMSNWGIGNWYTVHGDFGHTHTHWENRCNCTAKPLVAYDEWIPRFMHKLVHMFVREFEADRRRGKRSQRDRDREKESQKMASWLHRIINLVQFQLSPPSLYPSMVGHSQCKLFCYCHQIGETFIRFHYHNH